MSDLRSIEPYTMSAVAISEKVRSGEFTIAQIADFYIRRTEALAARLNSHLYWNVDLIHSQVERQEQRLSSGESLILAGVPVLVKDNICTSNMPTTCASKMLDGFRPTYDAHVIGKLTAAGAIIFGKTNCDEFAMGSSNENSAFGVVHNPWDLDCVPGGSSGGSAAAVAADLSPVSLGSDTGGSIRQPAAFCGVYGLKPTYGAVSRYGLVAYASSLDQIGPFARTAQDTALIYDVIAGFDARDSTSRSNSGAENATDRLRKEPSIKGRRLGIVTELMGEGLDEATRDSLKHAVDVYRGLGVEVTEVSIPSLKHSVASYYLIATAEASANLARFDGIRFGHRTSDSVESIRELYSRSRSEGFGKEVKQRIMLGTFALSAGYYDAYYSKAEIARTLISQDFATAFRNVDLLLAPVAPTTAFKIGERMHDPLTMYMSDICTLGVNLAGLPALSVPCGFDRTGLPVGMQLIGPALSEADLLVLAAAFERAEGPSLQRKPTL